MSFSVVGNSLAALFTVLINSANMSSVPASVSSSSVLSSMSPLEYSSSPVSSPSSVMVLSLWLLSLMLLSSLSSASGSIPSGRGNAIKSMIARKCGRDVGIVTSGCLSGCISLVADIRWERNFGLGEAGGIWVLYIYME